MKSMKKIVIGMMTVLCIICGMIMPMLSIKANAAAGRMVIGLSNPSANVGEQITVYITAKDAQNASVSANIKVSFNTEVFEYVSSNAGSASCQGNEISVEGSSVSITFKAIAPGECRVVASGKVEAGELTAGGVRIPVNGEQNQDGQEPANNDTKPEENNDTKPVEKDEPGDKVPSFEIDGKTYEVSEEYGNELVNLGFVKTDVQVQSVVVKGLSYKETGWVVLFLVNKEDDTDNGYYLYNAETGEICPYLGYGIGDEEVENTSNADSKSSDYELLNEKYEKLRKNNRKMLIGMIVGFVILILLFVNVLIFRSINKREDDDEYDDDDDEFDDEYNESDAIKKQGAYLEATASNSEVEEERTHIEKEPDLAADVANIMKQNDKKKTSVSKEDSLEIIDFEDL